MYHKDTGDSAKRIYRANKRRDEARKAAKKAARARRQNVVKEKAIVITPLMKLEAASLAKRDPRDD